MRTLIAGCGYVGTALGLELAGEGHTVFGLRRDTGRLPPALHPVRADLAEPRTLDVLPDDLDAVVYSASPSEHTDEGYAEAYVRGLCNLLANLEKRSTSIRRVVLTTSTAVYGQTGGEWVDEHSPVEPRHFSGRRLLEAERVLASGPYPATAVRLAGIYGPGRTGLIARVREGRARCAAEPRHSNRIHRDDCAGLIAHLLREASPPPVIIGVDDAPADLCEVYRWVAAKLGVPAPAVSKDAPVRSRNGSHKRCRNDGLRATGYALRFPTYREGYAPLLNAPPHPD